MLGLQSQTARCAELCEERSRRWIAYGDAWSGKLAEDTLQTHENPPSRTTCSIFSYSSS